MANVGDKIRIIYMVDEPQYRGREGVITSIDDMGRFHGTWGSLALIPGEDDYIVLEEEN